MEERGGETISYPPWPLPSGWAEIFRMHRPHIAASGLALAIPKLEPISSRPSYPVPIPVMGQYQRGVGKGIHFTQPSFSVMEAIM